MICVVCLTGSIGMGKSTTAQIFADAGVPVWDADAAVHRLYSKGGAGVAAVADIAPQAILDGAVDRTHLRAALLTDNTLLPRIEAAIHPLVSADRAAFLAEHTGIVLCDIPLLFETATETICDLIVVVSAPAEVQRARVLERPGMTSEAFETIVARQTPDAEKRARADYVIDTSRGLEAARAQVHTILEDIRSRPHA